MKLASSIVSAIAIDIVLIALVLAIQFVFDMSPVMIYCILGFLTTIALIMALYPAIKEYSRTRRHTRHYYHPKIDTPVVSILIAVYIIAISIAFNIGVLLSIAIFALIAGACMIVFFYKKEPQVLTDNTYKPAYSYVKWRD